MWNPFRSKPLLTEEDEYFQVETFRWLLTHFGGTQFYNYIQLVLPTNAFFPEKFDDHIKGFEYVFEQVRYYMGLQDWPCKLVSQEDDPNPVVAPTLIVQNAHRNPLGTFTYTDNNEAIITYNPSLVSNPTQLIATLAHELAHYLTGTAQSPPPGGWDNWEFATDIAATFLGFGIFQANAAFNFQQYADGNLTGWKTSGGGYLSQAEHSYSLALFLRLKNVDPALALPHCDTNVKTYLKKALTELDNANYVEQLRSVKSKLE